MIIGFQVTVENVVDVFLRNGVHVIVCLVANSCNTSTLSGTMKRV